MSHPAYSSDLDLCYFWLFDFLKWQLRSYSDEKSLKPGTVTETLENISKEMYRKTLENWIERMKLCIKYLVVTTLNI